jgi:hypothetical protein
MGNWKLPGGNSPLQLPYMLELVQQVEIELKCIILVHHTEDTKSVTLWKETNSFVANEILSPQILSADLADETVNKKINTRNV